MKKVICSEKAPGAIGPYSQAIEANGMVFVSGQLPIDAATGIMPEGVEAQARQSLENIRHILEAAGLTMADIVKTTVFLQDICRDERRIFHLFRRCFPGSFGCGGEGFAQRCFSRDRVHCGSLTDRLQ